MIELIKKAMFTGLGVASLTKEKVEEIGRDFVEQGKLSQQEGEKLVEEILAKVEEAKEDIRKQVEGRVEEIVKKMNLVRMSDLEELKSQIKELQDRHTGKEKT
ncbi:MAG: hypothetical protein ABIJ50_02945 [Pseudomonadota bacterium]